MRIFPFFRATARRGDLGLRDSQRNVNDVLRRFVAS